MINGNKEWSIMSTDAVRMRNGGNAKGGKVRERRAKKQGRGSAEQFQMVSMCRGAELSWLQAGVVGH